MNETLPRLTLPALQPSVVGPRGPAWYGRLTLPPAIVCLALVSMLSTWVVIIHRYGASWPFWDELDYLPQTLGGQPLSWEILWAHHNGHRLLLPKLVYFGLMKASGQQPAVLMYLSATLLTCSTSVVILALRRARGQTYALDTVLILTALSLSQYQNLLWAFQIYLTMSASLVLLVIALAIGTGGTKVLSQIILIGVIATLLPFCGGLGMGLAPGLFVWLIVNGLVYSVLGVEPHRRTFATWSCALGLIACGVWGIVVHGLPPSTAVQQAHNAVRSWAAVGASLSGLYHMNIEVFSTAFLPESIDKGLPLPYRGEIWGHFGLFLFVSGAIILLNTWVRRPQERLRIAGLAGCVMGGVSLILVLYIARGVYGLGAGAVPRYATLAMPLLMIAIAIYDLLAPELLRRAALLVVGAAHLTLIYGPHGNLAMLHAFARTEHDRALAAIEELSRPSGTTVEELAGHFGDALYGPGDARQVPSFIEFMAVHRIGPFRTVPVMPRRIATWNASPFLLRADAVSGATWNGRTAVKAFNTFGVITEGFATPTPISALRFTFRFKSTSADAVSLFVFWHLPGDPTVPVGARQVRWECAPDPTVQTGIVYIFDSVERIDIGLSRGFTEWELLNSEQLEPAVMATRPH